MIIGRPLFMDITEFGKVLAITNCDPADDLLIVETDIGSEITRRTWIYLDALKHVINPAIIHPGGYLSWTIRGTEIIKAKFSPKGAIVC